MKDMKRIIALLLSFVMVLSFAACGNSTETEQEDPSKDQSSQTPPSTMYKDIMGDVSTFEQEPKLIVFQNLIKPGFLNGDKAVSSEKKTVDGAEVDAYPIANAIDMFKNELKADVTIIDEDGKTVAVSAEKFKSAYIATAEDGTGIFIADGTTVPKFKYAVTADKEAILFTKASETLVMKDVLEAIGANASASKYRFVATDKFYLETDAAACAGSEIRGTLSGAVNASLPIETASGKINDILYVDIIDG